jgi:hypothetical protein
MLGTLLPTLEGLLGIDLPYPTADNFVTLATIGLPALGSLPHTRKSAAILGIVGTVTPTETPVLPLTGKAFSVVLPIEEVTISHPIEIRREGKGR